MKNIALFLFLFAYCFSLSAQESYPKLSTVKNIASIDKISFDSPIDKSLDKFNSKSVLAPLSLSKNKADKNAYTPKKFNFSINPYVWFMSIGGTVGYVDGQKFGFNKSFSDAVKYLKMAAAVAGKFKYERVSFVYDISYINLKGFGTEVPANTPHVFSANWTVKQALYDLFLAYLLPSKSKTVMVDIYAGGRLWDLQTESTIIDSNTSVAPKMRSYNNSWLDPVIGINAEYLLSKDMRWFAYTKGDIGGFGVNSQMTWQLTAGAGYMLSKANFPLSLGFKYVGLNHDKDAFAWTVNEYGLALSIGYRY